MLGVVFLSGCSGVSRFNIQQFADSVNQICGKTTITKKSSKDESKKGKRIFFENNFKELAEGIKQGVEATSKTGCSANITATNCSVSCGGSDTPKAN